MAKKPSSKGAGKSSQQELLPSRHALSQLTGGDPYQRSLGNYAKETPGVGASTPDIMQMAGMGGQ